MRVGRNHGECWASFATASFMRTDGITAKAIWVCVTRELGPLDHVPAGNTQSHVQLHARCHLKYTCIITSGQAG